MATERSAAVVDGRALRGPDLVVPVVAGISIAAWLALWWWSLGGGHTHHDGVAEAAVGHGVLALGLGWLAMVAAMMLPLATDVLGAVRSRVHGRARGGLLVALTGLGFVTPWLAAGLLLYLADGGLAAIVGRSGWLSAHTGALTGAAVAGAGVYQLTSLKRRSLTACRSPAAIVDRRWKGGAPGGDALRTGVAFGGACVACCWALMAVTLMAGPAGMLVMMFFAGVMLIEGMTPWGPAFARRIGIALLAVGLAWAALGVLA